MAAVLRAVAEAAMAELGLGHTEAVYHTALLVGLAQRGVPYRSEVCCPFMFAGRCVGSGRADIVLDSPGTVVELKATGAALPEARQQLARYANALGALERREFAAVLLVMDRASGAVRLEHVDAAGAVLGSAAPPAVEPQTACAAAFKRRYRCVPPGPEACGGLRLDRLVAHLNRSLAQLLPQRAERDAAVAAFVVTHMSCRAEHGRLVCRPRDGGGIVPL
jgi:GxxExxY protein